MTEKQRQPSPALTMSGFTDHTPVLRKYSHDPILAGRFYFLIPPVLLQAVTKQLGPPRFDRDKVTMDLELGALAAERSTIVALYDRMPVTYPYLSSQLYASYSLTEDLKNSGSSVPSEYVAALQEVDEPLDVIHEHIRAYCGWLMANPPFLADQSRLLSVKPQHVGRTEWVLPEIIQINAPVKAFRASRMSSSDTTILEKWQHFYRHWRLSAIVAPGLPLPYIPQRGVQAVQFVPTHLKSVVHTVLSTGIFPAIDRDLIEQTLPSGGVTSNAHFSDWMKISSLDNRRRHDELRAWGRRFELQHRWRVLHERYPEACRQNTRRLEGVFAKYLGVQPATVRSDLQLFRRRLGSGSRTALPAKLSTR